MAPQAQTQAKICPPFGDHLVLFYGQGHKRGPSPSLKKRMEKELHNLTWKGSLRVLHVLSFGQMAAFFRGNHRNQLLFTSPSPKDSDLLKTFSNTSTLWTRGHTMAGGYPQSKHCMKSSRFLIWKKTARWQKNWKENTGLLKTTDALCMHKRNRGSVRSFTQLQYRQSWLHKGGTALIRCFILGFNRYNLKILTCRMVMQLFILMDVFL